MSKRTVPERDQSPEAAIFDINKLREQWSSDTSFFLCLTELELSILISLCRYIEWESRWIDFDTGERQGVPVEAYALLDKLLTGCDQIAKSILVLAAAVAGQTLDGTADVDTLLEIQHDFLESGLAPRIATQGDTPMADRLAPSENPSIQETLGEASDYEDELLIIAQAFGLVI